MSPLASPRIRRFGAFCYIWLMLGFFTGTLLLVGPVRWLTAFLRQGGFEQRTEDAVMIGVIALFVIASALAAWLIFRRVNRCATRPGRMVLPAALTVCAALCLYAWTNPAIMASAAGGIGGTVSIGNGTEFVFGPYPDRARLQQLKNEGFTAVVSLQHPAVVPFEPPGIAEELRATGEIGLTFIHAPMLPWISANDESLNKIRTIAREGSGRYYVHCGLGRDRANVVKRMLEQEGVAVGAAEGFRRARTFADRYREGNKPMERGQIVPLEDDVFMVPFPNKHEMFGNMLSGQVGHVLVLLDSGDAAQRPWIDEARARFLEFNVPHSFETPRADSTGAVALARKAAALPRPLIIIVPFTPPQAGTAVADSLIRAWKTRSSA